MHGVIRRDREAEDGIIEYDLNFPSLRAFVSEFSAYLCYEGLFIPADPPDPPSSVLRFRVVLPDDFILIEGTGVVSWVRQREHAPHLEAGMAVRFASMRPQSQELIDQLVSTHVKDGGTPFGLEVPAEPIADPPVKQVPAPAPVPDRDPAAQRTKASEPEAVRFQVRGAVSATLPVQQEPELFVELAPEQAAIQDEAVSTERDSGRAQAMDETAAGEDIELLTENDEALPLAGGALEPSGTTDAGLAVDDLLLDPEPADRPGLCEGEAEVPHQPSLESEIPRSSDRPAARELPVVEATEARAGDTETDVAGPGPADDGTNEALPPRPRQAAAPEFSFTVGNDSGEEDDTPRIEHGTEFNISLFEAELEPDSTPLAEGAGAAPEVTFVPSDEELAEAVRPKRRWLAVVAVVIVAAAAAAAGYLFRAPLLRLARGLVQHEQTTGQESAEDGAAEVTDEGADKAAESESGGDDALPRAQVEPDPAAVPAGAGQRAGSLEGRTRPTAAATAIVDISWSRAGARTVVALRANGRIVAERVAVLPMDSPPRVLVKIRGVAQGYPRSEITVGSPQLRSIRVGHHPELSPPALYVVLDRASPGVQISHQVIDGSSMTITLQGS